MRTHVYSCACLYVSDGVYGLHVSDEFVKVAATSFVIGGMDVHFMIGGPISDLE